MSQVECDFLLDYDMDAPEAEKLITEAVNNRPTVTSAPLNLYFLSGRVVCGTRVVMPQNAHFICHISPDNLVSGFDQSSWAAIIERTLRIFKETEGKSDVSADFSERRREERLKSSGHVWVNADGKANKIDGQMVDVSSGGISFTCRKKAVIPDNSQKITAQFSVPWFGPDGKTQMRKFTRTGKICRTIDQNSYSKKVAVQFTQPLPFKPAHQSELADVNLTIRSAAEVGCGK